MTRYVWKHLPYAVYLDTDRLRSAGPYLNKPWLNELLSITNEYGITLCMCELVLKEWCEHLIEILKSNRQKVLSSTSLLRDYNIQVPYIKPKDIGVPERAELTKVVRQKLVNAGFSIVENWDAPLSQLINEAVEKRPPFEHGGKGLCDAVMLESYTAHAKETFAQARVLVVSHDKAVRRSAGRFEKHGVFVEFADESDIVAKLKSLLKVEIATYIEEEESRLKEYILQYESDILDFVRRTPLRITDWMLNSPLAQMKDEISGTIERILSITPIGIAGVLAASRPYGEEVPEDRYPVQIHVEIEIDVVVRQYGFGHLMQTRAVVQPDMIDGDSPVTLERTASVQPQENTKTIKRTITVYATLDSEKEKQKILDGFRIERIV